MTGESLLAALVAVAAFFTIVAGLNYWRLSSDYAPLILMPALLYTLLLYAVTVVVEMRGLWTVDIRIYYRVNAFLLVFAILTTFGVRYAQRRKGP